MSGDIEGAICDECGASVGPYGCCSAVRARNTEIQRLQKANLLLLDAAASALAILPHVVKFLKFQRPGREFWPNREAGEAAIDRLHHAIVVGKEAAKDK